MDQLAVSDIDCVFGAELPSDQGSVPVLLQAKLDADCGGLKWYPTKGTPDDLRTLGQLRLWFWPMLNDHYRNRLYEQAIATAVAAFIKLHNRAPRVLDIGTGTGLLAMLAVRHGADKVYAVDQFPALIRVAKDIAQDNNMAESISFFSKPSSELTLADLDHQPCDMVVSELLDYSMLGEGLVPALRDAYARLLVPSAVCVPHQAQLFVQAIHSPTLDCMSLQHEQQTACPSKVQAIHADQLLDLTCCTSKQLVTTVTLDHTLTKRPTRSTVQLNLPCKHASNGVLFTWELALDQDRTLIYNSHHEAIPHQGYQDHWSQAVWPMPTIPAKNRAITVNLNDTDYSIDIHEEAHPVPGYVQNEVDLIVQYEGVEGLAQRKAMMAQNILSDLDTPKPMTILDISDSGWLLHNLARQQPRPAESTWIHLAGFEPWRQHLLQTAVEEVTLWAGADNGQPWQQDWGLVDVVLSNAHFCQLATRPIAAACNLINMTRLLRPVLQPTVLFYPTAVSFHIAYVYFHDLSSCFQAKNDVLGLDHSSFIAAQSKHPQPLYLSTWQYHHKICQHYFLGTVELDSSDTSRLVKSISPPDVQCNAIIVWAELDFNQQHAPSFTKNQMTVADGRHLIHWMPPTLFLDCTVSLSIDDGNVEFAFAT
eukprot:TRINITY_DN12382_c0_g1_i1.p2 TRINITY_DN12382_c0_g1~~TRINITY_DN12382_c0_g1_i1.p2  ORF type:complete len:649 (+),score=106.65 TRINITY_DN12382_c0_g1_i1:52-1998(+)